MALTVDSTSHGIVSSATSLTISHTTSGSSRLLVVGIVAGASDIVTGVTYAGVSMSRLPTNGVINNGNSTAYMYYLVAPALGANNIVISTSTSALIEGNAVSFNGASGTQPNATASATASAAIAVSNTVISTVDNCVHVAAFAVDASGITSYTNGTTIGSIGTDANSAYSNPLLVSPAGSHTIAGNSASNNAWATVGAAFAPGTQEVPSNSNYAFFM